MLPEVIRIPIRDDSSKDDQECADLIIQDGWPPILFIPWNDEFIPLMEIILTNQTPVIATFESIGKIFQRNIDPCHTNANESRKVRIIASINQCTGLISFHNLDSIPPQIIPSELPHLTLDDLKNQDNTEQGSPSYTTVLKHGASHPFVNLIKKWIDANGDPSYRVPKSHQGGWNLNKNT
jgi:hypothetical protein